jgi:serine/threonine protein kinase
MSPEQFRDPGSVDHRADLYAMGVVFYFMLTGALPVQGSDAPSIALSVCQYIPPSPRHLDPSIPAHVDQACSRLLVKDRDGRFQSAEDFIRALDGAVAPSTATSCPSCGGRAEPDFTYCPQCGARLATSKTEARCFACGGVCGDGTTCLACKQPFSASNHRVSFGSGSLASSEFRIPEGIYLVGRDTLSPRDGQISRHHVHVACLNGTVHIQDAGSTNKTYVGGRLAEQPTLIGAGDELRIAGNTAIYTRN